MTGVAQPLVIEGKILSYQVIARKWRSQSFDQLVGQSHVTTTLQNALKNNRLPHALLFTGPRGTGKTSSARILAKALRCPNSKNFVPCNQCSDCEEISLSRSPNVIEIDGASNNGVDAIRELRDTVAYSPSSGKYKIYIIDEVHMLSTSAFNALLKTLEEPPDHVIFIMATTEVHKIPQTILSRCQRFDFRRIATRMIADRLKLICESDKIAADSEALWMIARQGDGSMRDAQSLLDQVITFANGPLTKNNVIEILGLTDHSLLLEVISKLVSRDARGILSSLQKIALAGYEPSLFAADLLENIRHLLLIKISQQSEVSDSTLIELPDSEVRFLQDLGQSLSEEDIHLLFDMMLKGASDIGRAGDPRTVMEMVLLRMASAPRVASLQSLFSNNTSNTNTSIRPPIPAKSSVISSTVRNAPTPTPKSPLARNPQDRWFELVQSIKIADSLLAAKIENLLFIAEKNKVIELAVPAKMSFLKDQMSDRATRDRMQAFVDQQWGTGYSLSIGVAADQSPNSKDKEGSAVSARANEQEKEAKRQQSMADQVAAHPKMMAVTTVFKGQIKSITSKE